MAEQLDLGTTPAPAGKSATEKALERHRAKNLARQVTSASKRDGNSGRYRKGVSGNPSGRPKKIHGHVDTTFDNISKVSITDTLEGALGFYVKKVLKAEMPIQAGKDIVGFLTDAGVARHAIRRGEMFIKKDDAGAHESWIEFFEGEDTPRNKSGFPYGKAPEGTGQQPPLNP